MDEKGPGSSETRDKRREADNKDIKDWRGRNRKKTRGITNERKRHENPENLSGNQSWGPSELGVGRETGETGGDQTCNSCALERLGTCYLLEIVRCLVLD